MYLQSLIVHICLAFLCCYPTVFAGICDNFEIEASFKGIGTLKEIGYTQLLETKPDRVPLDYRHEFENLTASDLKRLATPSSPVREIIENLQVAGKWPKDKWSSSLPEYAYSKVRFEAGVVASRLRMLKYKSGEILSPSSFEEQGLLLGLSLLKYQEGFRYDTRSPDIIRASGGFHPNPELPVMSLADHVYRLSRGGGNFVSISLVAESVDTIAMIVSSKHVMLPRFSGHPEKGGVILPNEVSENGSWSKATQASSYQGI